MTTSVTDSAQGGWTPPTVEELQLLLPQYEIEKILGHGGMGAVYKGQQAQLGRAVAIKVLPETLIAGDDDHQYVERFKLEARAMANLDHPAIISVHDFGQTEAGHLYFVMEYIDGMDIEEYILQSGGTVDPDHTVAIVSHVLDALDYAHSKGIVHRDIKPANVLINREGRVKIADFGLAKEFAGDDEAAVTGLTMTNMAMGTPNYIAPEALDADAIPDHRADLYAVGVMLYKMLTGKLPRGMFKLPSEQDNALDERFDDIIASAMESDPNGRFQNASEFRRKLDELQSVPISKVEPQQDTASVTPVVSGSQLEFPASGVQARKPAVNSRLSPSIPKTRDKGSQGKAVALIAAALLIAGVVLYFVFGNQSDQTTEKIASAEKRGTASQNSETRKDTSSPEESSNRSPEGIDLLALIDPDRDAVNGDWGKIDGSLVRENLSGIASLRIPYTFPERYTFRALVTPIDTGENITFAFPVFDNYVQLVIGGWGKLYEGKVTALTMIDGMIGPNNETAINRHSLTPGQSYAVEITVFGNRTNATIEVKLDRERIILWNGDPQALSVDLVWWEERSRVGEPSIYIHHHAPSIARFSELRLTPLTEIQTQIDSAPVGEDSNSARAPDPTKNQADTLSRIDGLVADGEWHDVLNAIGKAPSFSSESWTVSENTVVGEAFRKAGEMERTNAVRGIAAAPLHRFDAKMRFSADPETFAISMFAPSPAGGMSIYAWFAQKKCGIQGDLSEGGPRPKPIDAPLPDELYDGKIHEMEVKVDGSKLEISFDGESVLKHSSVDWSQWNQTFGYGTSPPPIFGLRVGWGKAEFHSFEIRIPKSDDQPSASEDDSEIIPTSLPIPEIPDLLSRLDSYRQYRKQTLGALISNYQVALKKHKDAAISSGDLDAVEESDLAVVSLNDLTGKIASHLEGPDITPVSPLPPTEGITGQLQKLETDFRNQIEAAEADMTEKLGQSLTICETALTKNNQIEDALAVRDFRLTLIETMTTPIENRAEAPADSSGWIDLYDPEKWEIKGGSASFKFEDGAIVGRSKPDVPSTYLSTREDFADFELEFEMKFDEELSSGVQIRSKVVEPGTPKENVHGPQVDIARSPGKSGFLFEQGTGRGFLNGENDAHTFLKNGEWNRFKIVANGQRIQTWVNDNAVSDLSNEECYMNFPSGVIALQVFRTKSATPYEFRWRNMRIRKLIDH